MNSCEVEGFHPGRFHPTLEINERGFAQWLGRDVLRLSACKECRFALLCGGGCGRLVVGQGGDLAKDAVCPPLVNLRDLQVLMDYYLPLMLDQ